jgi:hypothetical protein
VSALLSPAPGAVAEYFARRRASISRLSADDILFNETLWQEIVLRSGAGACAAPLSGETHFSGQVRARARYA